MTDRPAEVESHIEIDPDLFEGLPPEGDPWRDNELYRRVRLREDGRRALGVNLAEQIELSEFACRIAGTARR